MDKHTQASISVKNKTLGYCRKIVGSSRAILTIKAKRQSEYWRKLAKRRHKADLSRQAIDGIDVSAQNANEIARVLTKSAEKELDLISSVWQNKSPQKLKASWKALLGNKPESPKKLHLSTKPDEKDKKYQPILTVLDKLSASRREIKMQAARQKYENDLENWAKETRKIDLDNKQRKADYQQAIAEWSAAKKAIENSLGQYKTGERAAILDFCDLLLFQSDLPDIIPRVWQLDYQIDTQTLVIAYRLPRFNSFPKFEVFESAVDGNKPVVTQLAKSTREQIYTNLLYQLALRTIDEQFSGDKHGWIGQIVFNGYIDDAESVENEVRKYIMSIAIERSNFDYLRHTDAAAADCFKNLGGIGEALHRQLEITPHTTTNKKFNRC